MEGLQEDGSLIYEKDGAHGKIDMERHWWPQAEAVVGFLNAFRLTHNDQYLNTAVRAWDYIIKNLVDRANGEWYWSILPDGSVNYSGDKAGFWKCPYHNARACMEIITRCTKILTS
jgi:mannobiose 2-epimerase